MMKVPSRLSSALRLGLGLAMVTPAVLMFASTPARAESSFTARAEAQTFHVTVTNDKGSIPTLPQIDAGIGSAQANFTSFGGGLARAASPDAGSAASVPALLGAVVPTLVPAPLPITLPSIAMPGDVTVQAGQEPATVGTAPYQVSAAVTDTAANARASLGGAVDDDNGALRALSTAKVTVGEDGSVTARATSSVDGVRVNGLVSIGRVENTAIVKRDAGGGITRDSDLSIAAIELAGQKLAYRDGQFVSPVGNLPVPVEQVIKLVSQLTAGALQLEVVAAKETPHGIVGASLRLIQNFPEPPKCVAIPLPTPVFSGVTYCGTTTVVYDFGKAVATADLTPIEEGAEAPAVDGDAGAGASSDAGLDPAAAPLPSDGVPLGEVPPVEAGQAPELAPAAADNAMLTASARFVDMSNIYLALVGFAGLLLLSSTCIRMLGVRNKWTF